MAEFLENTEQVVNLDSAIIFSDSIPCNKGYIFHEDGTGNFILRGIVNNACCGFARYQVIYNGNIALPTGAADVVPIAVGITVNGEVRPTSRAIFTPAEDAVYGNVTSTAIITVPRGCCFNIAVRAISGITNTTDTPAPNITVQNSNLVINRIA